jgi:hypothetical protein
MHVTTRRRHPDGHSTSSIQAPSAHAHACHRVHTDDRQRHVQAAWGSNTRRGAWKQALGRLPMRNGSRPGKAHQCESANACICKIHHTAPAYERPPLAVTVERRIAPPPAAPERSVPVSVHSAPQCPDACHAHRPGDTRRLPGFSHRDSVHGWLGDWRSANRGDPH